MGLARGLRLETTARSGPLVSARFSAPKLVKAVHVVVGSFRGPQDRGDHQGERGVMQLRVGGSGLFRRVLLVVVALVFAVLSGIGIAWAATGDRHAQPAAAKAKAEAEAEAKASVGAVRQRGKAPVGAVPHGGKALVGAVRYRGHVLGLVAPLSARQR